MAIIIIYQPHYQWYNGWPCFHGYSEICWWSSWAE